MTNPAYFRNLFRYDDWANAAHVESLGDDPNPEAVRAMAHVLAARAVWLKRLSGEPTDGMEFYPSLDAAACRTLQAQVQAGWQKWLETLTPASLAEQVTFVNTFGETFTLTREVMLTHVLLHSAHHRGQVAMAQRQAGHTPADADLYISEFART